MFFLVFLLSLLPTASNCLAASENMTFSQARIIMRENSDAMKAAAAATTAGKETVDSLKTLWGPTISAQAVELWGETHIDIDRKINTPLGQMPVKIDEHKNFNGPRAAVTGTWPLFTGGKIRAEQKSAQASLEEAKAREDATGVEQDVKLIGYYFGLQLALAIEKVRQEMLNQAEKELSRAKKFEAEGMISKIERMSIQVAKDRSERDWLKARDHARIAKIQLLNLLRVNNTGQLLTPLFVLKKGLAPLSHWVDSSLSGNPQIAMLKAQVNKAEEGVNAALGNFSPDIFAFGQYSFIRHYQTMIEPEWMAGIGINLTLWDARGRVGRYKSAKSTARQARSMHAEVADQVKSDTEVAWQNTQNAMARYKLTKGNVELARENLELKIRGFEEGLNTALDMTDARTELAEARIDRKVAAYDFVVNYAILHAIAGKMDDFAQVLANRELLIVEN